MRAWAWVLMGVFALGVSPAAAEARQTYEQAQLDAALAREGLAAASPPGDARVAFVRIVRVEVFPPDDPWPQWLNWFHWTSVEEVVARELLFEEGDRFDARLRERFDETERILRRIGVFQLVRIEAVVDEAGRYGVLVFTRDLWSLRAEQAFQVTGLNLDRLLLQMTERNLLGRHKSGSVRFQMAPRIFAIGQLYRDRRLFGSDIALTESADLIFNQASGQPEGIVGSALLGAPLYDFKAPWGFDLLASGVARPIRQLRGSEVLTYDAPDTPEVEALERAWDERSLSLQARVRRQFGGRFKHRLAAGLSLDLRDVAPRFGSAAVSPGARDAFARDVLPRARDQLAPFLAYHGFTPTFRNFYNLDTFGRTEAVRLGPALAAAASVGSRALLSSTDFVLLTAAAALIRPVGDDGLAEVGVDMSARLEDGEVLDRAVAVRLRLATPTLTLGGLTVGRLALRFDGFALDEDSQNRLVTLGGNNGLRGYASQQFFVFGGSQAIANAEWRSPPLVWNTVHLGLTAFYDVGDVWSDLDAITLKHSVGVGLRVLLPQFNILPYRVDLGVPLDGQGVRVLLSFGDLPVVLHSQASVSRLHPSPF